MTDFNRLFKIDLAKQKSFFLLGPRQTGKTWLMGSIILGVDPESVRSYSLLDSKTFTKLSRDPSIIREECGENVRYLFIDEVQMLSILLNEVQLLISEREILCVLSGSSARKLKRKGVNLLRGRLSTRYLPPLTSFEVGDRFNLNDALSYGMLPPIVLSNNKSSDLKDYVGLYLTEEIAQERATRNVPAFSRFLEQAAMRNGELINFTSVANDSQVAPSTVRDYYSILEDTLIVRELPVWRHAKKLKAISMSKFYFFDCGVARACAGLDYPVARNTEEFGNSLESFIYQELWAYSELVSKLKLNFWRSTTKIEVDFIVNNKIAIEVKSTSVPNDNHLKGLRKLMEEERLKEFILVCLVDAPRTTNDGIKILPISDFLNSLWSSKLV